MNYHFIAAVDVDDKLIEIFVLAVNNYIPSEEQLIMFSDGLFFKKNTKFGNKISTIICVDDSNNEIIRQNYSTSEKDN